MRKCPRCKLDKPLLDYYRGKGYCKPCRKEYSKERYVRPGVRENHLLRQRLQVTPQRAARRKKDPKYRKYMRDLMRARYARGKAVIDEYKSKGCSCGEARLACLDLHHVGVGSKRHGLDVISRTWKNMGIERLKKKLAECEVVCSNCHRVLHAKERMAGVNVSRTSKAAHQ